MSFSNRFGKGLLASMESEQDVVEEVLDTAENVEADLGEAAEVAGDIDDGIAAIDQGEADAETLETIADTLEETEQEGGADPVTARVAEVAVEAIYARLGITRKPVSSMEAFGDKATRVQATKLSVEGIREVVEKVWEAVKGILAKIKDWLVNFYKSIFDAQVKLQKRAEGILEKAKTLSGTPAEAQVEGSFIKDLAKDGGFDKTYAIGSVAGLKPYAASVRDFGEGSKKFADSLKASALIADKEAFDGWGGTELFAGQQLPTQVKKWFGLVDDNENVWLALGKADVGSSIVAVKAPAKSLKGADAFKATSKMEVRIVPQSNKEVGKDTKAPTLNASEIAALCQDVIDGMKAFEGVKAAVNKAVLGLEVTMKEADVAGKQLKDEDKEAANRSKLVAGAVRGYGKAVSGISIQALRHATMVGRAGLAYAEKSMAAHKAAGKKEEAKA